VRLERLVTQTQGLTSYHQTNPIPCRAIFPNPENFSSRLFGHTAIRSNLTGLCPLSFLVPAVLESLVASTQYRDITEIVPGEADLYCAKYLKQNGGIIFTGDSDLLVHDLGPDGAVSLFRDVEFPSIDNFDTLCTKLFQQSTIVDRLALPKSHGLHALAFEMTMDNHCTFPKLLAQAKLLKAVSANPKMYEEYLKEYTQLPPNLKAESGGSAEVAKVLKNLDPRISEYALQFPCLAEIAGQPPLESIGSRTPHIFLPFLIDCPVRTNAWEVSSTIRQLAYGLMNLCVPKEQQISTVFEHRKQQDKSPGRELQLPIIAQISEACTAVSNLFEQLQEKHQSLSETQVWTAVAVNQELEWSHAHSRSPLSHVIIQQFELLESKTEMARTLTWDIMHFFAQIQGSYYSLRMLKQIAELVVSHGYKDSILESVLLLNQQLESLPALADLADLSHVSSLLQTIPAALITDRSTVSENSIQHRSATNPQAKESRRAARRKRKRENGLVEAPTPIGRGKLNNPFDVLGDE
jgi:hypothetical protein